MLLKEINAKTPAEFEGWICVPRGSIGPTDLKTCWVFPNGREAARAAHSDKGSTITRRHADYLPYYKTDNGISIVLHVTAEGLNQLHDHGNKVYAFSITEKSCKEAGFKAWRASKEYHDGTMEPWVYKVDNSDPAFFDEEDQ